MKRRRRLCKNTTLLASGIFLVSVGIILVWNFNPIYELIINSALVFNPTSKAYTAWKKNDPPLIMDIFLFNWTNPEDIRNKEIKPKFKEIGPFRFKEIKEKINITWNENKTVTYRHMKHFFFDEDNSPKQLTENITTINAVSLTAAYRAKNWSYFTKLPLSALLSTLSSLYITKSAAELLFDGYEDSFLSTASIFTDAGDRFGFFYQKNETVGTDGVFNLAVENNANFGKLMSWNYQNRTPFYEDTCGDIRGSSGEFYPINRKRDKLEIFSSELCRYAILEYEDDVEVKGVHGYKYTGKNMFDNGTIDPVNECFCGGECIPSGVLNVSSCRQDSPTFLSLPHFYGADSYYIEAIEGVEPVKEKHEFYITLEPKSGVLIDIGARMQLNMLLQPVRGISMFEDVPRIFFPIFYFTQQVPLNDELASDMKMLQNLPHIFTVSGMVCSGIGGLLILWTLLSCLCHKIMKDKNSTEHKINRNTREEVPLGTWNGVNSQR